MSALRHVQERMFQIWYNGNPSLEQMGTAPDEVFGGVMFSLVHGFAFQLITNSLLSGVLRKRLTKDCD